MGSFNADFYVTVATVIPVLYLALTLQGKTFENLMARWKKAAGEASEAASFWLEVRVIGAALVAIAAGGTTLYSVYAEFLALRALYWHRSTHGIEYGIFTAAVGLLIVTAAGPLVAFVSAYIGTLMTGFPRPGRSKRSSHERSESAGMAGDDP